MLNILVLLTLTSAMLMNMPATELFSTACYGTIGNLYEFGTPCKGDDATSNGRCPCDDMRFLETTVSCISMLVANYTSSDVTKDAQLNISLTAFTENCPKTSLDSLLAFAANSSDLPDYGLDRHHKRPGTWPVKTAFRPSDKEVRDALVVLKKGNHQENENKRFGAGLVAFWAGVALVKATTHYIGQIFPLCAHRLHRAVALRMWRSSIELRVWRLTPVATLRVAVLVAFVVLTTVFTFIDLNVHYPDYTTLYRNSATFSQALAMRSGVISLYLLPLLILFAGRNNFLIWFTGWPQDAFVLFHRWVARVVVLEVLVHAIAYTVNYAVMGSYRGSWGQGFWTAGIIGLAFGMFTLVQGCRMLRSRAYDLFLVLHIVAVIIFLVTGYYHLKLLGEPIGLYFFYASFAIWGFDRAARILRVLSSSCRWSIGTSSCRRSTHGGWFGMPATIELERDVLVITVPRPSSWNVLHRPGSHVFVHFLLPMHFWQSHPFTIVSSTDNPNEIKLFVKVHKGITRFLANKVLEFEANGENTHPEKIHTEKSLQNAHSAEHGEHESKEVSALTSTTSNPSERERSARQALQCRVLLDGPYGCTHDFFEFDTLVFVAGGTGITAPFSYIHQNALLFPRGIQRINLFWAVRNPGLEQWFKSELEFLRQYEHIDVRLYVSHDVTEPRRLDVASELFHALNHASGPTAVLACGPPSMNSAVKRVVAAHVRDAEDYVDYFEESFTF